MQIPIAYNLRNLRVRKTTTIMTALGIALTVAVLLSVLALVSGLQHAFATTGHPLNVLVMRNGSTAELSSNFTREQFQMVRLNPAIARDGAGEPLASVEMVTVVVLELAGQTGSTNINVRGVSPAGIALRDGIKLEQGRWFTPGRREVVVGRSVAARFPDARLGGKLEFGRGFWEVVGVMSLESSAINSEIWADVNQASSDYQRSDVLSSALLRAASPAQAQELINTLEADQRLNVDAMLERSYYAEQTSAALPIQFIGTFVAVIMAVGSCFAAMNTMYAAVSRRGKEIGTLRVLGFSKGGILFSFFVESVLLSLLGGLMGILLVLPLNNVTTGIGSFTTFSEIAFDFRVTPEIMIVGLLFGLVMGALGGIFPAASAARKEILTALREV
jgi:putative ABC transport system permease protein